jgi:hypothetical protein
MMYPRLALLRVLLAESGALFMTRSTTQGS